MIDFRHFTCYCDNKTQGLFAGHHAGIASGSTGKWAEVILVETFSLGFDFDALIGGFLLTERRFAKGGGIVIG